MHCFDTETFGFGFGYKSLNSVGDSGGPLWVENDGKAILVGIVSRGRGCAKQNVAGIYTRLVKCWQDKKELQ